MKALEKSVFNLIEIFASTKKQLAQPAIPADHCEQKHHHDFYCDAEKPFINNS
ncbi:hypothetical protein HME9304_01343 [Flagellimonas maritima]|uniref:Uncharacterized protein n=1 Tax=Flagellimonas maritima TaxID=1383885 RepID=A0A2Z4LR89_9FLAO|nr:hypothetical protein [Allomuricauda aurantiaca]AWX44343.1 hypothetical protein HME9304_01343 [Allomuricauda aurantiaca]